MSVEILMPELGESVHEGTVSRWLKKIGEFVNEDEPVVEIMTDKVNTELGAPASGILSQILVKEGDPVEVFKAMGVIETDSSAVSATLSSEPIALSETPVVQTVPVSSSGPDHSPLSVDGERRWYTPVVRAMADANALSEAELALVSGTGSGGRVTKRDLENYLASGRRASVSRATAPVEPQAPVAKPTPEIKPVAAVAPGADKEIVPLVGMRKMIAEHMVRSAAVPTVTTITQVDVTAMVQFRERNKDAFLEKYRVKLTYTPFFIKALSESLLEHPLLNAALQADNTILMTKEVHIGVAVALGKNGDEGLIVPVIRDCHAKTLVDIARDLDRIAKKARANQLSLSDVQGGTFTLTNPGTYGAMFGTPMINAPQAAILGTYAIQKMPVIVDDMIAIRSIMHLVLTYDHRLVDGLLAGKFLASVRDRLQKFDFFR